MGDQTWLLGAQSVTPKFGSMHIFPHICKHAYTCTKRKKKIRNAYGSRSLTLKKKCTNLTDCSFRCYCFFVPIRAHFPSLDYKTKHQLSRKRRLISGQEQETWKMFSNQFGNPGGLRSNRFRVQKWGRGLSLGKEEEYSDVFRGWTVCIQEFRWHFSPPPPPLFLFDHCHGNCQTSPICGGETYLGQQCFPP